jgi:hypothetical protein
MKCKRSVSTFFAKYLDVPTLSLSKIKPYFYDHMYVGQGIKYVHALALHPAGCSGKFHRFHQRLPFFDPHF